MRLDIIVLHVLIWGSDKIIAFFDFIQKKTTVGQLTQSDIENECILV